MSRTDSKCIFLCQQDEGGSFPAVRTSAGPDDSQKAMPNFIEGLACTMAFIEILDGLDEVGLPEDEVHIGRYQWRRGIAP